MNRTVTLLLALLLLCGCGATVQSNLSASGTTLRQYPKLHLILETASGAVSLNSADLHSANASGFASSIGSSHAMSGESQAPLIAQDLSFQLASLGFQMVDSQEDSDAVAIFSIGTVRYDPITGWIADQAFLLFRDSKSGNAICSLKADTRFITPTVKTIVRNLMREVTRQY